MRKSLFIVFTVVISIANAVAQDLGIELEASKKIAKGLELSAEGEIRTQDLFSDMERFSIGGNISYKATNWIKVDAGYLFMLRRMEEHTTQKYQYVGDWNPRHRAYVGISLSWEPVKHFTLSWRSRYQYTYSTPINLERYYIADPEKRASDKVEEGEDEHLMRNRLQLKYSRKKCAWEPYLSIEMLNELTDTFAKDQIRYTLGTDYKFNKHNQMGLSYRYKDKSNNDDKKGHLITLSFSHAF